MGKRSRKVTKAVTAEGVAEAISIFRRAAGQRFEVAEFLAKNQFGRDAIYLAGYGVECAMKAALVSRTPFVRRTAALREITSGQKGHSLESLKTRLGGLGCHMPEGVAASFRTAVTWSTAWRYEVGRVPPAEANRFLKAAADVIRWAERCYEWPFRS